MKQLTKIVFSSIFVGTMSLTNIVNGKEKQDFCSKITENIINEIIPYLEYSKKESIILRFHRVIEPVDFQCVSNNIKKNTRNKYSFKSFEEDKMSYGVIRQK